MLYNILEQSPEDARGLPLLPLVWWRAGMGPHLPEKALHDPSTDSLSTHAIDVDAEEEGHAIDVDAGAQSILPKKGQRESGTRQC
eukprot:1515423-Amphidinium_carterae.1